MTAEFDVDYIASYLKPFKEQLSKLYEWKVDSKRLGKLRDLGLDEFQVRELENLSPFNQCVKIKEVIGSKLRLFYYKDDDALFNKLALWIIVDWGGIKSVKEKSKIIKTLLPSFLLTPKPKFESIASCSKVASFLRPNMDVIYDSRALYSLNWILLKQGSKIFFPMPLGRGPLVTSFDIETIIRLFRLELYHKNHKIKESDTNIFLSQNSAYYEYRILVEKIHKELWSDQDEKSGKLYYTEMLLFVLAEKHMLDEVVRSLTLELIS